MKQKQIHRNSPAIHYYVTVCLVGRGQRPLHRALPMQYSWMFTIFVGMRVINCERRTDSIVIGLCFCHLIRGEEIVYAFVCSFKIQFNCTRLPCALLCKFIIRFYNSRSCAVHDIATHSTCARAMQHDKTYFLLNKFSTISEWCLSFGTHNFIEWNYYIKFRQPTFNRNTNNTCKFDCEFPWKL